MLDTSTIRWFYGAWVSELRFPGTCLQIPCNVLYQKLDIFECNA